MKTLLLVLLAFTSSVVAADDLKPLGARGDKKKKKVYSPTQIEALFKRNDKNGDGKITIDEFRKSKERFKLRDLNKDGSLSKEEHKAGFAKKEETKDTVDAEADVNPLMLKSGETIVSESFDEDSKTFQTWGKYGTRWTIKDGVLVGSPIKRRISKSTSGKTLWGKPTLTNQKPQPDGMSREIRRGLLDDLAKLNESQYNVVGDPEIQTRISQYEMAYKMQASVPELTDFSQQSKTVVDSYGPSVHEKGTFAYNCLMARRLIERGTRFVQVMHAGWDQHNSLTTEFNTQTKDTDQPAAALINDLQQRALLDETLVIFGGEFGRTPFLQGSLDDRLKWGRDHHPYAFSYWMAGGGMKRGHIHGGTDEFGFHAIEDKVHVHDFQATILHLLGIDHEQLTYKHHGRRFRLTDVHGHVVKDILA